MSSAQAGPSRYGGFQPVPILLPKSPAIPWKKPSRHYLWIREHRSTKSKTAPSVDPVDDLPNGRTLFVAGLPVDAEESDLRAVFSEYGAVETVLFKVAEQGHASDPWAKAGDDEDEDEDEDEDDDDDDDEDAMDDDEGEEAQTVAPSEAATSRRARRKLRKPPPPPQVIPLPSLDPRSQPFLPSCSSCYLVYLDGLSLQRAVALAPTRPPIVISRSQASPSGLSYYLQQHRLLRPSLATIKQHADTSMALFDHHQAIEQARTSKPITDEDGFTLVVRSGRSGRTAGKGDKGVAVASRRFVMESKKLKGVEGAVLDAREGLQRGKPKKKKTQFEGFYRFQRQEQKRQELANLRAAFEADKAKVADLKAKHRFKPY